MTEKIKAPVVEVSTPDTSALNGIGFRQVFDMYAFDSKKFATATKTVILKPSDDDATAEFDESGFHVAPETLEKFVAGENGLEALFKAFLSDLVGAEKHLTKLLRYGVSFYLETGSLDALNWIYSRLLRSESGHIATFNRALKIYGFEFTGKKVTGAYSYVATRYAMFEGVLLCQLREPKKEAKPSQLKEDIKAKAHGRAVYEKAKQLEASSHKQIERLSKSVQNSDYTPEAKQRMNEEIQFHQERNARAQLVAGLMNALDGVELATVCIPDIIELVKNHLNAR